jgi:acyl carrier protein
MERGEVVEQVLVFLGKRFGEGPEGIAADARLSETMMLDSLATLEIVIFIEEQYGLTLERADLDRLTTPGGIADLILEKQKG